MASYCSFLEREKMRLPVNQKAKLLYSPFRASWREPVLERQESHLRFQFVLPLLLTLLAIFAHKFLSAALMISLGKMLRCGITRPNCAFILGNFDPLLSGSFPDACNCSTPPLEAGDAL